MSNESPWSEIKTPEQDYYVRKVPNIEGMPMYWGKDNIGQCLFIVVLSGDQTELFRSQQVTIHGIKSDLRLVGSVQSQCLVISLEEHIDQDLFSAMCETIISALLEISDSAKGLSIALSQIRRWKAFMAGQKRTILSPQEVRGLFAELTFFRQLNSHNYSNLETVRAWEGPESTHQDFIFSNTAVEIKSLSGRERNSIHISSEDQLESLNAKLFLKIFRLIDMPDSERAHSLNDLIHTIESELKNNEALECFYDKLAKVGYVELRDYDNPKFIIAEERLYRAQDDFPKLVRSKLPDGIKKTSYEIELEKIIEFQLSNSALWEEVI